MDSLIDAVAGPLAGLKVTECFGGQSTDVSRVAVSFAGLMARRFGAEVLRVQELAGDPMRSFPPFLHDGSSALFAFLTEGKTIIEALPASRAGFLLTDAPALIEQWPNKRTVLIRPHRDEARQWSELTLQAASGLLDVFGEKERAPLALPGHQIAYATGMAAFNALICVYLGTVDGIAAERSEVRASDVALWVNWKHCMAAWQGNFGVGRTRTEEWTTMACRDGYVTLVFQDKDIAKLAQLIGNDALVTRDFANRTVRGEHLVEFVRVLSEWMATRSRQEIVVAARALAIPIGPVLAVEELVHEPQLRQRAFFEQAPNSGSTRLRLPVLWHQPAPQEA